MTCVSSALETGEGSGDAGTLLTARAQPFHGVFHLRTGHLQQSIQRQLHRDCLEDGRKHELMSQLLHIIQHHTSETDTQYNSNRYLRHDSVLSYMASI